MAICQDARFVSARVSTPMWLAAICLVVAGCQCGEAVPTPDAGFVVQPNLKLTWRQGIPLIPHPLPAPPSYQKAIATWHTATVAFSHGNYPVAADRFVAVAALLKTADVGTSTPALDNTRRAARCMAYQNAAVAWQGAAETAVEQRLEQAAVDDPACAHSIERALLRLHASTTTTSTMPS